MDDDELEDNENKDFCASGPPTTEEIARYVKTVRQEEDEISNQLNGKAIETYLEQLRQAAEEAERDFYEHRSRTEP